MRGSDHHFACDFELNLHFRVVALGRVVGPSHSPTPKSGVERLARAPRAAVCRNIRLASGRGGLAKWRDERALAGREVRVHVRLLVQWGKFCFSGASSPTQYVDAILSHGFRSEACKDAGADWCASPSQVPGSERHAVIGAHAIRGYLCAAPGTDFT